MDFVDHPCHDSKRATTASSDFPEKVLVLVLVYCQKSAIGCDDVSFKHVVDRKSVKYAHGFMVSSLDVASSSPNYLSVAA